MIKKIIDIMSDLFGLLFLIFRSDKRMKGRFDHSKLGNVIIDSENIMKGTIVIMNVGSAALQDLAVCCFHQITGMVFGGCSFFLIADRIKNSIGWSVSDISVCNMTIYNVDDGMFRLRSFQSQVRTGKQDQQRFVLTQ